jgi:pimeloyl-ACP methyl ester carboxylesterase
VTIFGARRVAALLVSSCVAAGCASSVPRYSGFDDVPYGYTSEQSVWAPRAGTWIRVAELAPKNGDTSATPALLIHPWSTNMLVWRDVAPRLAESRRVVLLDLPGHGKSGKPHGPHPVERLAAAARDVLEALAIPRAIVVGNSIGGATSIQLALDAPMMVERLVLLDAPGGREVPAPIAHLATSATRPRPLATMSPFVHDAAWRFVTPKMPPLAERMRDDAIALSSTPAWRAWARATSASLSAVVRWAPKLEALDVPTLVVQGADDRVVWRGSAEALAARIRGAKLALIPDCGHMPQIECPDRLWPVLEPFVNAKPR